MSRVKLSLVAITMISYLFMSGNGLVYAHCPEEGLFAFGSFSIDEDEWYPYISGSVWVGNLTYWPRTVEEPSWAYISSDHSVYALHYYEDVEFDVYWSFRLSVDEDPHNYQSNPRYSGSMGFYDPDDAMPHNYISDSETLWVDVTDLRADEDGVEYYMSAYTRLDAYYEVPGQRGKFSWKDCQNGISFLHTPPPRN